MDQSVRLLLGRIQSQLDAVLRDSVSLSGGSGTRASGAG